MKTPGKMPYPIPQLMISNGDFSWYRTNQHSFGSFSPSNQRRKRNKRNRDWKEVTLSLFADDLILYIENPKDTTRKLLELINEYSKVAGYNINTQKSLTFLYTNNEKIEREIKETIPYTIAMKRIKYLGIDFWRATVFKTLLSMPCAYCTILCHPSRKR